MLTDVIGQICSTSKQSELSELVFKKYILCNFNIVSNKVLAKTTIHVKNLKVFETITVENTLISASIYTYTNNLVLAAS